MLTILLNTGEPEDMTTLEAELLAFLDQFGVDADSVEYVPSDGDELAEAGL